MCAKHGADEKPFCLYVAHESIHNPVQVPGDPVRRTKDNWDRWKWREVTEEERIAKYKGMTLPIDDGVGQLRKTLIELGIAKKHLRSLLLRQRRIGGLPQWLAKFAREQGQRLRRRPQSAGRSRGGRGEILPGTASDQPMISIDVMPTLLRAGRHTLRRRETSMVSMFPHFCSKGKQSPIAPLFWASMGNNGSRAEAMRDGPWKLVALHPKAKPGTFENEKVELYHLAAGPVGKNQTWPSNILTERRKCSRS